MTGLDSSVILPPYFDHEKLGVYRLDLKFSGLGIFWLTFALRR
jgi:hypothetical protein